jgi:hypothetical protein
MVRRLVAVELIFWGTWLCGRMDIGEASDPWELDQLVSPSGNPDHPDDGTVMNQADPWKLQMDICSTHSLRDDPVVHKHKPEAGEQAHTPGLSDHININVADSDNDSDISTANGVASKRRRHGGLKKRGAKPQFLHGTKWWAELVWTLFQHIEDSMPDSPKRSMVADSFCSGMATECFGYKARCYNIC